MKKEYNKPSFEYEEVLESDVITTSPNGSEGSFYNDKGWDTGNGVNNGEQGE